MWDMHFSHRECPPSVWPCQNFCTMVRIYFAHVRNTYLCSNPSTSSKMETLEQVFCDFPVEKKLPHCEHAAIMACSDDPSQHMCSARCGLPMKCCSKICNSLCHECQKSSEKPVEGQNILRTAHKSHPCQKEIHCGHRCQEKCSENHKHTVKCKEKCRQSCTHAQCRLPCSVPCAPCQQPCPW